MISCDPKKFVWEKIKIKYKRCYKPNVSLLKINGSLFPKSWFKSSTIRKSSRYKHVEKIRF